MRQDIYIEWEDGAYNVYEGETHISDTPYLQKALEFALSVAEYSGQDVIVRSIET